MRVISPTQLYPQQVINILNQRNNSLVYALPFFNLSKVDLFISPDGPGTPLINGYIYNTKFEGEYYVLTFEEDPDLLGYEHKEGMIYVFKVKDEDRDDFNLLKQSKYSQISLKAKEKIILYWDLPNVPRRNNGIITELSEVFSKPEHRFLRVEQILDVKLSRDMEIMSAFNKISETYNFDK